MRGRAARIRRTRALGFAVDVVIEAPKSKPLAGTSLRKEAKILGAEQAADVVLLDVRVEVAQDLVSGRGHPDEHQRQEAAPARSRRMPRRQRRGIRMASC
jgi:hypothetical protein